MKPVPPGWPRMSAALYYDDAKAAIEWLCNAFGFEVRLIVETGDGGLAHSELVYGEAVIMVAQSGARPHYKSPKQVGGTTQSLMFFVDDLDAHHDDHLVSAAHGALLRGQRLCTVARALPGRDVVPDARGRLWLRGTGHPVWGSELERAER